MEKLLTIMESPEDSWGLQDISHGIKSQLEIKYLI